MAKAPTQWASVGEALDGALQFRKIKDPEYNQSRMAEEMDTSEGNVSRWIRDISLPEEAHHLLKLAEYLDISLDELAPLVGTTLILLSGLTIGTTPRKTLANQPHPRSRPTRKTRPRSRKS